ncbi:homoserine kinase [Novosphingobium kunmingense]|uniref:Homoserine kinase n=1 Tax=Novosphingobium kunmingense TaxID=1211806 RepID=A0A2N0HKT3_9SPHN|nr:homoserine kinase [Novosphingobium kunmingense]PKB19519.1 homoserine kinase [Novosphingobium kunmingense]
MAVYTHLGAEEMAELIGHFDVGTLVSAKGIAEGVSNSNWLIETTGSDGAGARFILTMYEFRIDTAELPYFLALLDHLAAKGCPVPRTIHDRQGQLYRTIGDKAVALIEYLPGVSVSQPTPDQARAVGEALARLHLAAADFPMTRANAMDLVESRRLLESCGEAPLAEIDPALPSLAFSQLDELERLWPQDLPQSVIHADLFPDNVLMLGNVVTGLIDFYFSCNGFCAYDVAVTHAAWCFSPDGQSFDARISMALLDGYETVRPLSSDELKALPILARAACLRFLASRAYDWINTPADALVAKKDPRAFGHRLERFYANAEWTPVLMLR